MTASAALTRIPVGGEAPYDVVVGEGVVADVLPGLLEGVERCAVIAPDALRALATPALDTARAAGCEVTVLTVPDGEAAKDLAVAGRLWDELGRINLTRSDAVVAVGGGATTDVAGYVAAAWLRGVRWIAVPTSLLGMVDAAVGGKTAINTAGGKNLVGAFHPPAGVIADLSTLEGLPEPEWVNGMAEVVKAGFIADPQILDVIEAAPSAARGAARELVERAVAVKAEVVGKDLRESGPREFLNYGHTLGHAIELRSGWRLPHGHAVAIGMVFVAEVARITGRIDEALVHRHRSLLAKVGLPTSYDDAAAWPAIHEAMTHDKKARGATLRLVLLDGLARPVVVPAPDEAVLRAAWDAITSPEPA